MTKVVWITGCASGVGKHLCESFIRRGYRVLATDLNIRALEEEADRQKWPKDQVQCSSLDVTSLEQWQHRLEGVLECWQKVDYLFNVAGYLKPGYCHEIALEEVDRHFDINVKGLIYGSQLVARQMVQQGDGHIVNIASTASLAAIPGLSLYSASKFAVRAFTLAMAEELKPLGVKATVICPDAIQTPMLTLQEDYEEAAMTFSGSSVLTVKDIERLVFEHVLLRAPRESILPWHRGVLAKLGNVFPALSSGLVGYLKKRGIKRQLLNKSEEQR